MEIYKTIIHSLDKLQRSISPKLEKDYEGNHCEETNFISKDHYGRAMAKLTANWKSNGAVFITTYLVGLIVKSLEIIGKLVITALASIVLLVGNFTTFRISKVIVELTAYIPYRLFALLVCDPILHGLPLKALAIIADRIDKTEHSVTKIEEE